jgi:hypothetical protein
LKISLKGTLPDDGSIAVEIDWILSKIKAKQIKTVFTFRIYEIYKGKHWFHSKNFEKFCLLKTCFLPIKSHKT